MAAPANVPVSQGFARLFETEAFSDCKVICGPYHFNLHKAVLSGHSDYFATAFKSGTFKEEETGVIELEAKSDDDDESDDYCDDPEIFKLMIEYFYHFDYKLEPASPTSDPKTFLIEHAKVVAMGVKYQADGLRKFAAQKFKQLAETLWDHEDFAKAIRIVQQSTANDVPEFWEAIADTVYMHFKALREKQEVNEVIRKAPSLAYSLLERSHKDLNVTCNHVDLRVIYERTCPKCGTEYCYCETCHPATQGKACAVCKCWIH